MLRSSVFAAAAAMALVTAPAYAQVKWDLPSAYPAYNFHSENLAAFARDVADVTGGKLAIKVYPNASLFPATAIKQAWDEKRTEREKPAADRRTESRRKL